MTHFAIVKKNTGNWELKSDMPHISHNKPNIFYNIWVFINMLLKQDLSSTNYLQNMKKKNS